MVHTPFSSFGGLVITKSVVKKSMPALIFWSVNTFIGAEIDVFADPPLFSYSIRPLWVINSDTSLFFHMPT